MRPPSVLDAIIAEYAKLGVRFMEHTPTPAGPPDTSWVPFDGTTTAYKSLQATPHQPLSLILCGRPRTQADGATDKLALRVVVIRLHVH